ncbi:hypothetical protein RRG08_059857 [Elysia crispata]|uniref:Uncharacterized protein n=1 Tax=Elysia crispata TaxID=231223 RepID=A0AAE1CWU9_9GAST|nr:hypothetical protein RRG08_059857 [Elysia crispata]
MMVKRVCVDLQSGEQGDNVAVSVPRMTIEIGGPRNILGVIIDRREDKDQYRKAIKAGILNVEHVKQAVSQGTEDQSVLNHVTEAVTVNNVRKYVVCIVDGPSVTMSTGFVTMAVTLVTMVLYVHRNVLLGNTETDVRQTAASPVLDQTMPVTLWMGPVVPVIQVTRGTNVI